MGAVMIFLLSWRAGNSPVPGIWEYPCEVRYVPCVNLLCLFFLDCFVALPHHSKMSSMVSHLLTLKRGLTIIDILLTPCQVFGLWCHLIVPLVMFRPYHPGSRRTWLTGEFLLPLRIPLKVYRGRILYCAIQYNKHRVRVSAAKAHFLALRSCSRTCWRTVR